MLAVNRQRDIAPIDEGRETGSHETEARATEARMAMSLTPYTTWHVEIDDERNPDADLSQVTEIRMKLYGFEMEKFIEAQLSASNAKK